MTAKSALMWPSPKLKMLLAKVFDDLREGLRKEERATTYAELRQDFVFHMTDWLNDLSKLYEMYQHPEKVRLDDASLGVMGFLYHVIPHLSAAGRLLLDEIPDAFEDSYRRSKCDVLSAKGKSKRQNKSKTRAG
jgi:hypothetical protein